MGKLLYGLLFTIVLPLLLAGWAAATRDLVRLPAPDALPFGVFVCVAGLTLLLLGTRDLWVHGGGLPMSPYPPPRLVRNGVFSLIPHPIYTGACLLCAGISIVFASPSGFWLVTPVVMLSCAAFVLGYEREALARRLGGQPPALLPSDDPDSGPSIRCRALTYFLVLLPWLALYMAVLALGVPPRAITTYLPFEEKLGVIEWTHPIYVSCYVVVCLVPIFARSQRTLREFEIRGLLSMAFVFPFNLTIPLVAPARQFIPETLIGKALSMEWSLAAPAAALPSFHVIWSLIAAEVFADRQPRLRWLWRGWAAAVAVSCITTGMHSILDVLAGVLTFLLVCRHRAIWEGVRNASERLANSWREWRIGPIRIINHAVWAGLGGACGLLIATCFAGPEHKTAILATAFVALITAALWAQFIEGSPALLRPYGFYGGVAGVIFGAMAAPLFGTDPWLVLGALSAAGPWLQSLGRVRCLVQGCCHGRPGAKSVGIRYVHPRSRVCKLADLAAVPVHPTPVYSILWNVFIALFVTRLWLLGSALHLIAGVYLILTGLGRFVEEAYRGEPQTPYVWGLRLYQWIGIASVVLGAAVTALGRGAPAPEPVWSLSAAPQALAFGIAAAVAMGVDLPEGQRRFSRLA